MARPRKAIVDYFPHSVSHGKTMFTLESKYGNNGYAFWFKLLEILGATENHYLDANDTVTWEYLLAKTSLSEIIVNEILSLLSKLGSINTDLWKYKIIRSDKFIENLEVVYKRRDVNVLTNSEVLDLCRHKHPISGVSVNINPQSKVKYSKVNKSNNNVAEISTQKINEYTQNKDLQKAMNDFIIYRINIKSPLTDNAVDLFIKKLSSFESDQEKIDVIEKSILNGWKGIFPDDKKIIKNTKEKQFQEREYKDSDIEDLYYNPLKVKEG
jgi:hypothetical protein